MPAKQFLRLVLAILTVPAERFGSETEITEGYICDLSSHHPKLCPDATKKGNIMTAFSSLFSFSFSVPFLPSGFLSTSSMQDVGYDWALSPEPRFMAGSSARCDSLKLLGWMPFSDATLSACRMDGVCIPVLRPSRGPFVMAWRGTVFKWFGTRVCSAMFWIRLASAQLLLEYEAPIITCVRYLQ
ncbi:hypothetical protein DL98DRAFT_48082 [Cadophora sp. DSE1049]|nr:hypothetical protein DL98DRAFT_48082 [Cadophora sp. DSE1049]